MTYSGDGSLGELLESLQTLEPEPWSLAASAPTAPSPPQELQPAAFAASGPQPCPSPAQLREVLMTRVDRVSTSATPGTNVGAERVVRHARWKTPELSSTPAGAPDNPRLHVSASSSDGTDEQGNFASRLRKAKQSML